MTHTSHSPAAATDAGGEAVALPCVLDHSRLAALALLVRCSVAALLDELMPMFAEDGRAYLHRLRQAQTAGLWADVRSAALALGAGALDIGAARLGSLCRQLEALSRQEGGAGSDDLLCAVEDCFADTCAALAAVRR